MRRHIGRDGGRGDSPRATGRCKTRYNTYKAQSRYYCDICQMMICVASVLCGGIIQACLIRTALLWCEGHIMNYSEAAYFDGAHVAHIAAWQEYRRALRLRKALVAARSPLLRTGRRTCQPTVVPCLT